MAPPFSPPATILAQAAFNEWGQCYAKFGLLYEGQPDIKRVSVRVSVRMCVRVCVEVCLAECVSLHPAESLTCANICLASRPYWLSVFFADCVCLGVCVCARLGVKPAEVFARYHFSQHRSKVAVADTVCHLAFNKNPTLLIVDAQI